MQNPNYKLVGKMQRNKRSDMYCATAVIWIIVLCLIPLLSGFSMATHEAETKTDYECVRALEEYSGRKLERDAQFVYCSREETAQEIASRRGVGYSMIFVSVLPLLYLLWICLSPEQRKKNMGYLG